MRCSVVFGVTSRLLVIKHFAVFSRNQHSRLLPAMCHNLRDGGRGPPATVFTTPGRNWPPSLTFQGQQCAGAIEEPFRNILIFTWCKSDHFGERTHRRTDPHLSNSKTVPAAGCGPNMGRVIVTFSCFSRTIFCCLFLNLWIVTPTIYEYVVCCLPAAGSRSSVKLVKLVS